MGDIDTARHGHGPGRADRMLYFTVIRYEFPDWAVAVAVDPASSKTVDSIALAARVVFLTDPKKNLRIIPAVERMILQIIPLPQERVVRGG